MGFLPGQVHEGYCVLIVGCDDDFLVLTIAVLCVLYKLVVLVRRRGFIKLKLLVGNRLDEQQGLVKTNKKLILVPIDKEHLR